MPTDQWKHYCAIFIHTVYNVFSFENTISLEIVIFNCKTNCPLSCESQWMLHLLFQKEISFKNKKIEKRWFCRAIRPYTLNYRNCFQYLTLHLAVGNYYDGRSLLLTLQEFIKNSKPTKIIEYYIAYWRVHNKTAYSIKIEYSFYFNFMITLIFNICIVAYNKLPRTTVFSKFF